MKKATSVANTQRVHWRPAVMLRYGEQPRDVGQRNKVVFASTNLSPDRQ